MKRFRSRNSRRLPALAAGVLLLVVAFHGPSLASEPVEQHPREARAAAPESEQVVASVEEELLGDVHETFQAFLDRDRERIQSLHSHDWIGFLGPSTRIERGIEDYMIGADRSLDGFRGLSYEILESEVQVHGDIGLVFYVARYEYEQEGDRGVLPLRSVDVFQKRAGAWIQTASHIAVIPSGGQWGEGDPSPPK